MYLVIIFIVQRNTVNIPISILFFNSFNINLYNYFYKSEKYNIKH